MMPFDPTLYVITDSTGVSEERFLYLVEEACKGGETLMQLREKEKTARAYLRLAILVHAITSRYSIPLILDDRADIALAANVEGVHVGQSDLPVAMARKILGKDKIVGATAKTVLQAQDAYAQGADYLGVGAIYPTTTKVKTVLTPVSTLCDIVNAVPIPVNAIGGLNENNLSVLKGSGIAGACAVSAIMKSEHPCQSTQALKQAFLQLEERS